MSEIDFAKEAADLGKIPKQDYKLGIDLGDDAPPRTEESEGKPFDAAAKDIAAEQEAKKSGGAFVNAAKMMIGVENAVAPRITGMVLKQDYKQFVLDDDSEDLLVEMLAPVLEFHQFKPKDPTLPFIICYAAIRLVPIWDAKQQAMKATKKAKAVSNEDRAKGRSTTSDDDTPVSPAEEVDDNGNVLKRQKFYHKDGTLATGDIRICKHVNCNNALTKTQQKFCSHSCKAYQQALDKVENE